MAGMRDSADYRNELVYSYLRFVEIVKLQYIFFENVIGITMAFKDMKAFSEDLIEQLTIIGYKCEGKIIDFSEFGVPQKRKRFILFGTVKGNPMDYFSILDECRNVFFEKNNLIPPISIAEAISDLEANNGLYHVEGISRFLNIPPCIEPSVR